MYRKLVIYFRIFVSILELIISEIAKIIAKNVFLDEKEKIPAEKKEPDWLDSLRGELERFPLLEESELKFIRNIRNEILQEAQSRPSFPSNKHLKNKLSLMKNNFKKVVKNLKKCSQNRHDFLLNYPRWRTFRQTSILELKDIAKALNINKQGAAAAVSLGSGASLVGGLVCLVTGAGALRLAGSVLMGLGSLASAAISWAEMEVFKEKIKKAEEIISQDKWWSKKLWYWISDMSYIQESLDTVRSIEVATTFKKISADLHSSLKKKKSTEEELSMIIKNSIKSLIVYPEIANDVSDIIGILTSIAILHDRFRPLFKGTYEASKCYRVLSTACTVIATTARLSSAFNACTTRKLTTFQVCRLYTGIALDAMNIIHASKNLDSKSEEAEQILEAAKKLEEEAKVFYKLYEEVRY